MVGRALAERHGGVRAQVPLVEQGLQVSLEIRVIGNVTLY